MALIVAGRLNKQVSYALGISEITVKAHRAKMMRKMKAVCFAYSYPWRRGYVSLRS